MVPLAWTGSKEGIRGQEFGAHLKTKVCFCPAQVGANLANRNLRSRKWVTCCK
jgi:hypothetical protein